MTKTSADSVSKEPANYSIQFSDFQTLVEAAGGASADLDSLIRLTKEEKHKTEQDIQAMLISLEGDQDDTGILSITDRIRTLETELERENSVKNDLTAKRDLAWQAYQALAQKDIELKNTSPTNSQVNFANQAISPRDPMSKGTVATTLISGFFGTLIAIAWIILVPIIKKFRNNSEPIHADD